MNISLTEYSWELKGFWPWVPLFGKSIETGLDLKGVTDWIPATVPGGVQYDLYRAGLIEHPHVDMDSVQSEWVENRWWVYRTSFPAPKVNGKKVELVFKGLDYAADIYLNNKILGSHEGMYHPAVFDITTYCEEHDMIELKVMFKGIPPEMSQIGRTSLTSTQKSRFNYKWDFSTRLVNIGIWDDAFIRISESVSIQDVAIHTTVEDTRGIVECTTRFRVNDEQIELLPESVELRVAFADPDGNVIHTEQMLVSNIDTPVRVTLGVNEPWLWNPNGHGEHPLYKLTLKLFLRDELQDEREYHVGIRKLEFTQNDDSPADALPYTFVVNGNKVYIKGVNMTPIDHLYGNVTPAHYEWMIYSLYRANVNMIRVWGGGIIEKEVFYDLCDKYGIMVWQEFIQSSSGVDNVPSKIPHFLKLLEQTARAAIIERRNHVSLTVWSGGNELMDENSVPATIEDENLAMLGRIVQELDPHRLFLPTSASGPSEGVTRTKGISHDVHGFWKYLGNPEHYEFYSDMDNLFHSEFGMDGVSSVKSLRKFLSPSELRPVSMEENFVWRHHGEWWDTFERDTGLFGELDSLQIFSDCSQWIQAEGLRFTLEANRRRKFQNSGSVIWQFNEPWPNASCTSLMDYYGEGKMAYYWTKKAFAPLHASLDYRRLNYTVGQTFEHAVFAHGSTPGPITVRARVRDIHGNTFLEQAFRGELSGLRSLNLGMLRFDVTQTHESLFFVTLETFRNDDCVDENVYTFSTLEATPFQPALSLNAEIAVEPLSDWESQDQGTAFLSIVKRTYRVTNTGDVVALHVHPIETTNDYWMESEGAFETLFPGESRSVTVYCAVKQGGGFLEEDKSANGFPNHPDVHFRVFAVSTSPVSVSV